MGYTIYQSLRASRAKEMPDLTIDQFIPKWPGDEEEETDPQADLAAKVASIFGFFGGGPASG